jgi:hypothetical protein
MSSSPMQEISDKSAASPEPVQPEMDPENESFQVNVVDLRRRQRAAHRVNRSQGLNSDALRYLQFVLRWLSFRGISIGMVFEGQRETIGGERIGWWTVDAMSGAWKDFRAHDVSGPDITGLVAYCHEIPRLAAARKLKNFLRALKSKSGMERHCDLDPNAKAFSGLLWPIPEPHPPEPMSFGWLGEPSRAYCIRGPDKRLAAYTLRSL